MRAVDCITEKRNGNVLQDEAIRALCEGYMRGDVPDYQMSAFLMAVYFTGLADSELSALTEAMLKSGRTVSLRTDKFVIDKHSTGGVGDKISLVLAPLLAALDFAVVKISGRGLGHTGGTIDKFESLDGFGFVADPDKQQAMLEDCGIALLSYTEDIVPLDKKLYALRDVTGTVESIPLIASSVMSKKLAVASDGIVLDVKVGSGAFMKSETDALALARAMKRIGERAGRKVSCALSAMEEPLGFAVGNALELEEAVSILTGAQKKSDKTPRDVLDLTCTLAGLALLMRGDAKDLPAARAIAVRTLEGGKPLEMLMKFVARCGANPDDLLSGRYKKTPKCKDVFYRGKDLPRTGYIRAIDAQKIGLAAMRLGAGRAVKDDVIRPEVGIMLAKKCGDAITENEPIARVYYTDEASYEDARGLIESAFTCSEEQPPAAPLIKEMLL